MGRDQMVRGNSWGGRSLDLASYMKWAVDVMDKASNSIIAYPYPNDACSNNLCGE